MQIVCESCGATGAAASVEVVDGAVQLRCASCGHLNVLRSDGSAPAPDATEGETGAAAAPAGPLSSTPPGPGGADAEPAPPQDLPDDAFVEPSLEAPPSSTSDPVVDLPPVKCPKCGHRQHDDRACHRCGLVFALVDAGDRPWERLEPHQELHAPRARELWSGIEARPADASTHAAFVDHCRQHDLLGFAAMRYRHWMADHPDDALSRSYLDRVVRDAQALVQAMSVGDDPFLAKARRMRNTMLVIVGVLCVVAMVWLVRTMASRGALVP